MKSYTFWSFLSQLSHRLALFSIGILKGVTKMHDTSRILAVSQSRCVAQFMNRLFHRALAKRFLVRPHAQAEQRNHRALSR